MYIVGTPAKIVGSYVRQIRNTSFGLNFGNIKIVAPFTIGAFTATVKQNTWNIGSAATTRSSAVYCKYEATSLALLYKFLCVNIAPFGFPVVPEVYRITATSSSSSSGPSYCKSPAPTKLVNVFIFSVSVWLKSDEVSHMMMFSNEGSLVVRDCITGRRTSSTMIVFTSPFCKM
ncbi:hypothetical protein BMB171_C0961 [Bacillus thuringiensis BMB171]|nr:hypothetical protein BMB171_C0961 [Bacillus thuringiensis BMB171]